MKRTLLLIATLIGAAGVCSAQQVNRCVDAAGKVSYSDSACPPGAKRSELVIPPEPPAPPAGTLPYQPPPPRETLANRPPPPPEPGGPAVFDHRGGNTADQPPPQADEAWRQGYYDYPYPYPGGGYGRPPPRPPRDMRPRLRNCDAAGCNDNQGNHYDNKGRVDRYVTPDGRNCRPIGTTVVCN